MSLKTPELKPRGVKVQRTIYPCVSKSKPTATWFNSDTRIDRNSFVIQWYNTKNICLPTVNEVLAVDFKSNPPKLQIVEHDDKTQVDSVTKCKIESLGGLPGESAKVWLTGMDSAFQSTHLFLINPSNSLSLLQRREMMKQLDEVETEYNDNQKLAANLVDNPLSSVLFVVPTAKKSSAGK